MRPIDADKLIEFICKEYPSGKFRIWFSDQTLIDIINKQPTLETYHEGGEVE